MEFVQHASVFTASGDAAGHIDRVVVDPDKAAITHIVVTKGFLFKEDKVVPIDLIAEANAERITLRENAGNLHELPRFEEKHYVRVDDGGGSAPAVVAQPLAGMPGAFTSEPHDRFVKQIERNIPEGTVALKEGARLVSQDGKQLGSVESVMTETPSDHATHLLISSGTKAKKLIPITWVKILGENEVELNVAPQQVEELGEYHS